MNLIMSLFFEENKYSNADIIPHKFLLNQHTFCHTTNYEY